jgi:hypothetical protein
MNKIILTLILGATAAAQPPAKPSLTFDGMTFYLKFVDQTKIVDLNEYYLRDEQPENWTRLVSVSLYKTTGTPAAMAQNMERSLLTKHPDAPHDLKASSDGSQAFFTCVDWAGDRKTTSEYVVFWFQKTPKGVLAYQASLRPYQAKISQPDFQSLMIRWSQQIRTSTLPAVTLNEP